MRRTILLVGAVALVLAVATPAAATTPSVVIRESFTISEPTYYGISCPAGFDVVFTASGVQTIIDYYDRSGAFTHEAYQFWFTGMLYNGDDLTKMVPYEGRGMFVSYVDGRARNTVMYQAFVGGKRVPLETGIAKISSSGDIIEAGISQDAEVLCGPLS